LSRRANWLTKFSRIFADPRGGFFDTSDDHENLVVRPKGCVEAFGFRDNATPSGSAMAAMVLCKLSAYTGEARYMDAGESALALLQPALAHAPTGFEWWLCALDFVLMPRKEIAIVARTHSRCWM